MPGFFKLKSFAQELVELGVSQSAMKRICKQMVLRTLEVHGAMIRSYYAAKFNPTTMDFSSSFKDAASNQVFARGRYLPAPRPGVASKVQYSHEEGGGEEDVGNVRDGGSIRSVEERVVWSHESGGHI
jgi:hypothetical protein